jgi:uncharacterized protein DUF3592
MKLQKLTLFPQGWSFAPLAEPNSEKATCDIHSSAAFISVGTNRECFSQGERLKRRHEVYSEKESRAMGLDSTGKYQTVLFLILILALVLFPIGLGIRELVIRMKLARSGVKVVGHITGYHKEGPWGKRTYYITYDYVYHGSTYSREEKVSMLIYDYYVDKDRVTVSCLPENPNTARLAWKIPASIVGKVGAVALLLIAIVVAISAVAIVSIRIVAVLQ